MLAWMLFRDLPRLHNSARCFSSRLLATYWTWLLSSSFSGYCWSRRGACLRACCIKALLVCLTMPSHFWTNQAPCGVLASASRLVFRRQLPEPISQLCACLHAYCIKGSVVYTITSIHFSMRLIAAYWVRLLSSPLCGIAWVQLCGFARLHNVIQSSLD